jgi:pyrroloquinoline quinone (PQQ) biosynthesis protein C
MKTPVYERLQNDKVWVAGDGVQYRIEDMAPRHRENLMNWLTRNAPSIKAQYEMSLIRVMQPGGDAANDAFDKALDDLYQKDARKWMFEQPLFKRLYEVQYSGVAGFARGVLKAMRDR